MSDSNGPVRRRRIAGESSPAAPPQKVVAKKAGKKAAAQKVTAKASAPKAPVAKTPIPKAPLPKTPAAKKPAVKTPAPAAATVARTSTPQVPTRKQARPSSPAKAEAVAVAEAEAEEKAARPAGSGPSRRDLLWLVPASLVAAAALVLGVFWVVSPPGGDDSGATLDTSRRQASSAAASAAETIFSFRFDQLDQHLTASKALMTPAFAKEFDSIAPALTELAPQRSIVVQAVARESAALPCGDECSSSKAEVLVFVDQARLVGGATEPTVFANRVKVSMVKTDDGWLVANIRAL